MSKKIYFNLLLLGVVFLLFLSCIKKNQLETEKNVHDYYFKGLESYREKNYSAFLDNLQRAIGLASNNPKIMYALARAYAINGYKQDALVWLNKTVNLGFCFEADKDTDFDFIRDSEEFRTLLERIEKIKIPVSNSETAFTIPEKDLMPEGIAYDPFEQMFYVGSSYKCKIVSIDRKGMVKNFISENQDGLWSVWGMKVDAERRILWVVSSPYFRMRGFRRKDFGICGIFKYDLKNRTLIKKYLLDERPVFHEFNDLVINSHGDVFISDDYYGAVYKISQEKDVLDLFIKPDRFTFPNGIALSEDEKYLYVGHAEGISIIDVNRKNSRLITHPENITVAAVDGLYFYQNSLIAIQGAFMPQRVIRFYLNTNLNHVESADILEINNPLFMLPTTGAFIEDSFYYIANSQLMSFDDNNSIFPMEKLHDVVILRINL